MKRLYEKVQKWLGVEGVEEYKVRRIAFWWLISERGDLVNVKAGDGEFALQLKRVEHGRPMWYESAPIEPEVAETLVGFRLQGDNWRICIDGGGEPRVNAYNRRDPLGGFQFPPEKLKIIK